MRFLWPGVRGNTQCFITCPRWEKTRKRTSTIGITPATLEIALQHSKSRFNARNRASTLEIALQRSESRPQHSESRVNIGNQGKPRKYGARRLCFPCRVVSTSRADWWHPVRRADSPRPRSDATSAPTAPPQNESEATAGIQAIANLNAAFSF